MENFVSALLRNFEISIIFIFSQFPRGKINLSKRSPHRRFIYSYKAILNTLSFIKNSHGIGRKFILTENYLMNAFKICI